MKNRNNFLKFGLGGLVLAVSAPSFADVSGAEAIFTGLTADFTSLMGYAWPVLALVTGGFIAMKLTKKSANKAT